MSLRQIYKQEKSKQQEAEVDAEELEKELQREKTQKKQGFSAFQMESEESEEEPEEVEESQKKEQKEGKKKKKNRKKKKKQQDTVPDDPTQVKSQKDQPKSKPQDSKANKGKKKEEDDMAFLDKIITQQQEESKTGTGFMAGESVLKMERRNFNYKKELKALFAKTASAYGALGLDEEEKEERKNRGTGEDYEGASKKMKRRLRMMEKMQEKNRVSTVKKYLMVQPDPKWPRVEKILTMQQVKTDKRTGQKIFSYLKLPEYKSLDKEFRAVQQTADIGALIQFLQRNFYHHESLLYFADFLRIQGKFTDSFHFLERCLFAFESAWIFDFQPVSPDRDQEAYFVPQVRLDMDGEPLNKVFGESLVKYIDILGRKGCSRTSVEYCKFLLGLSPETDLFGALLRIDFYALRAHDYQLVLDLVQKLPLELYPEESQTSSLLILPNLLMTCGLARYHQQCSESSDYKMKNMDAQVQEINALEKSMTNLIHLNPESMIITGMVLYPGLIAQLLKKVAQKQMNTNNKKSYFTGYQAKSWADILAHPFFTEVGEDLTGQHNFTWVLNDLERKLPEDKQEDLIEESLSKLWLKEIVGYVLNKIDAGFIDRDLMIAKFTSLVQSPFSLSRYRQLKTSDFTDDVTTINPNELLMGGGGQEAGVPQDQGIGNQQLQHMINQLNQPMNPQRQMMMQQQQQNPLIQDRDLGGMNEQELIAMQEAILAQMGENEDIQIDEDEGGQQEQQPGLMNYFNNIFGWGNQGQPPNNNNQ